MLNYKLTPYAKNDIRGIIQYTLETWGKKQTDKYVGLLTDRFNELHNEDFISKHVFKNVYVSYCEHHYIFYLKESPAIIIAVFHENMDLMTRLKSRLKL